MRLSQSLKLLSVFLFIATIALFFPEVNAEEQNWKRVYADEEDIWYINTTSISCPSENIVRVKVKWSPKNKKFEKDYAYSLGVEEHDCTRDKMRLVELGNYDNDGNLQHSFDCSNLEWRSIPSGSVGETLHKIICDEMKCKEISKSP